jgi:RNA polymerase sigma factor (sigma-70 family)
MRKLENGMNKALLSYRRAAFGKHPARRWFSAPKRLAVCCLAPDPQAKGATDLDEAMKQFTWWPENDLLKHIKDSVLTLASTQRKYPEKRPWKTFMLVDRRMPGLRLLKHINGVVERARERFTEAGFSDLETLEPDWSKAERFSDLEALPRKSSKDKDALNLWCDIDRIKENASAARAIDWAKYKDVLSRLPGNGHLAHATGNDTGLACYARVLELIIDHRRWETLRKESGALVFWLLEIGHPKATELKRFNHDAAIKALCREHARIQREREAKLDKLQQSKRIVKKSRKDIEDAQLMELARQGDAKAWEKLRERHQGLVKWKVKEILGENSAVGDITQSVFIQAWKEAHKYVSTPTAKFTSWLLEIAKNRAINEKNRAKKAKERAGFAHLSETGSKGRMKNDTGGSAEFVSWQGEEGQSETDDALRAVPMALSQLSARERRIIEARIMAPPSKRKDRQLLAKELGITAGEVEDLENELPGKLREIMHL